ncbi:MAG: hypothetical protein LC624_10120 [Halobacteriales archaeon]|nr:hypothetical protein [Halobacteriales archaeon]
MRGIAGLLAFLALLPTVPLADASAIVVLGAGTGTAVHTECPVDTLLFTMAAVNTGNAWNAQVLVLNPDYLCVRALPLLSMTGTWDPAAGGCLAGVGLVLCFEAAQPGATVPWRICRAAEPVCDEAHAFQLGTVTLLYA